MESTLAGSYEIENYIIIWIIKPKLNKTFLKEENKFLKKQNSRKTKLRGAEGIYNYKNTLNI